MRAFPAGGAAGESGGDLGGPVRRLARHGHVACVDLTGNPFTLAGAMGMSSRSLWEEGVTIPSKESVGALSDSPQDRIVQDQIAFATETTKQDMMQHLGEYTYTLDLSGKVVRDP